MSKSTAWIPLVGLFVGLCTLALTADVRFDLFGAKPPKIEVSPPIPHNTQKPVLTPIPELFPKSPDREPDGSDSPTNVSLSNHGRNAALVQWAEFVPETWVEPKRLSFTAIHVAPDLIPIVFRVSGIKDEIGNLRCNLPTPMLVNGDDEFTVLQVSLVWPEYTGRMLRGHLVVNFANAKPTIVENVVLNTLREEYRQVTSAVPQHAP